MKSERLRLLTLTGIFTALIFVFTAFIHIPFFAGYVHPGDGFLFLASCLLPTPFAAFAGAVGAALADCITGYVIWAPASFVIKAVTALFFSYHTKKMIEKRNLLALIPAGLLCIGGYYLFEVILMGSFLSAAYGIIGNVIQVGFSIALYVGLGIAFDKTGLKGRLPILHRIIR